MLTRLDRRWTIYIGAGNQWAQIAYACITTVSLWKSASLIVEEPLVETLTHTLWNKILGHFRQ